MRHDHLKKELDLLILLAENRCLTMEEISQETGISTRSLYYYIDFFRNAGFTVEKYGTSYCLSRDSDFFKRLFDQLQFSEEEAILLRKFLEDGAPKTVRVKSILKKLDYFYDFNAAEDESAPRRSSRIMQGLHEAMKKKRLVKLVAYSSPNSHTVKDRIVEPFLFMNNNKDIRCYELESEKNKTFRISRMESVEVLEENWSHEERHKRIFTDLFMFSGEEHFVVTLILGQLSRNLLLEEYPKAAPCLAEQPDGRWLFRTEVCSYLGIGRFVLGLLDDIEVLGDDGFKKYLLEKSEGYGKKMKASLEHENKDVVS